MIKMDIDTYYEGNIEFPDIKCKCHKGIIEVDISWGFDDGCGDSATYYKLKCPHCKKEHEFMQIDYGYEFFEAMEEFLKKT